MFIIPEVAELMQRQLMAAKILTVQDRVSSMPVRQCLTMIAAWLIISSMQTEQIQWTMLCIQNVANLYRKTAFASLLDSCAQETNRAEASGEDAGLEELTEDNANSSFDAAEVASAVTLTGIDSVPATPGATPGALGTLDVPASPGSINSPGASALFDAQHKDEARLTEPSANAPVRASNGTSTSALGSAVPSNEDAEDVAEERPEELKVFDEAIDFSLEAAVPDPVPFLDKLQNMLTKHEKFLRADKDTEVSSAILDEVLHSNCRGTSFLLLIAVRLSASR